MMGIWLKEPFKLFPEGFPDELIEALEQKTNRPVIGNIAFSGTKIIEDLGVEQMRTGAIIVYTSADSVLQIAAHEDVVPVNELYKICEIARDLTQGEYLVGRVIARPFRGEPGSFYRTERRRDYPLPPPANTVLDSLIATGLRVEAVGKIADIFTGRGITDSVSVTGNSDGTRKIVDLLEGSWQGLLFANLNDFDTLYGHRRDVEGYAKATSEFDEQLPSIMNKMRTDDLLIITADHGNDPTFVGSDHTREYAPLLVYYPGLNRAVSLGERSTFADIGCTIADNFQLAKPLIGRSFLTEIVN
jgi:phosphopentomutase